MGFCLVDLFIHLSFLCFFFFFFTVLNLFVQVCFWSFMPPACAAITVGFCKEIARQVKRMPASTCAYSTTPAAPLRANRVNKAVFMIFIISTVCCQGDDSDTDMHLKFIDIFIFRILTIIIIIIKYFPLF